MQLGLLRLENEEEGEEKRIIVISNSQTGDIERQVSAPSAMTLSPSPDGRWVAEGGTNKRIRMRDGKMLEVVREIRAHDSPVAAFAWHPKLPLLVSAKRGIIRIWNTHTCWMVEQLRVIFDEPILNIAEDGKRLILCRKTVEYLPSGACARQVRR